MSAPQAFDVIIVGGRPAGSTLAVRLGRQGLRVLLLERAVFPSPHPVSCPIIYAGAMQLLDEIGADESEYADNTPRIGRWINEYYDAYRTYVPVPDALGRNYGYAIDRARFDAALWRLAAALPTVTARQPFAVTDLLWDEGRVVGVHGHGGQRTDETFTASCVIGADGRFSTVAQKVNAGKHDERLDLSTSVYYAGWQNAAPYDDHGPVMHFCKPVAGYYFFVFDSADGLTNVAISGRAGLFAAEPGRAEALYMELARRHKLIWRRLAPARRATPVSGMRNIGNYYRTAGGPGWALVGDALHQKDPIDGQGIYDALFEAKSLATSIVKWKSGAATWDDIIRKYEADVREETLPMYVETLNQVKMTVYAQSPLWLEKLLHGWLGTDTELNERYGLLMVRALSPKHWLPASALLRAALRGAFGQARRLLLRQPHPALIPAVA